jgi:pilus assembly protein CpaB
MNNRAVGLSLLMGLIAVFFVYSYVSSLEEVSRREFGTEVVVIAAKEDINEMVTLNETMLELRSIPKRFLEPAAIHYESSDMAQQATNDMKDIAGMIALVPIKKGEQLTYNKITVPGLRTGLAPQVTPGKRGIAVPVNEVTGVSKLIKPGDRVDVIVVLDSGGGDPMARMAKTVLQDVVILAVGRNITNNVARVFEQRGGRPPEARSLNSFDGFASVTLEVEPGQAQMISLLLTAGGNALSLSLRNNDDVDRVNMPGVTLQDILGADAARLQPQERGPAGRTRR